MQERPMGRLRPKKEPTFGRPKKQNYTSAGDCDVNENIYIPDKPLKQNLRTSFDKRDFAQKQKTKEQLEQVAQKRKLPCSDKKNVFAVKSYMKYLRERSTRKTGRGVEVHHWMPRSKIMQNDFFVCCLSPEKHREIHLKSTVQTFISEQTIEKLLEDSILLFAEWLREEGTQHENGSRYRGMLEHIIAEPTFENALQRTRDTAEEIRLGVSTS